MTVDTHEIRLRGPWQVRLTDQVSLVGTVQIPCTIRFEDWGVTSGSIDLVRTFQWVAPRTSDERIALVLPNCDRDIEVFLNGRWIARVDQTSASSKLDLTALIEARNELVLRVDARPSGSWVVREAPTLRIETQRGAKD